VIAAGYAGFLTLSALLLDWLSAHTHRRSLRYRTAGFSYDADHDHWLCPEGEQLWPHELDRERRLVRYRARAQVCNACPSKGRCTDSDEGREVIRPLDPWPHSEAGRFHRTISLLLAGLALLVLVVELARHHDAGEAVLLVAVLVPVVFVTRWLIRDLRLHPSGFPDVQLQQQVYAPGGASPSTGSGSFAASSAAPSRMSRSLTWISSRPR
jgi:hypothetical protein